MPQFLKLGELWINADQITEVHIKDFKDGMPTDCMIKLFGEGVRELSGEEITAAVLAFLQDNEYKPPGRRPKGN
jgi:hypothetical protein